MPKNNRSGEASILNETDYQKIRKALPKEYRLLFDIARYTGERWGAIVQLRFEDVYDGQFQPLRYVTFRASTRKANTLGQRFTRQVPVHPLLEESLRANSEGSFARSEFLFKSSWKRRTGEHITLRTADKILRTALEKTGLGSKGYSSHSTRRTLATILGRRGTDVRIIQKLLGHSDIKSTIRYIEDDPEQLERAIALL